MVEIRRARAAFRRALHAWYQKNHRKLPWRDEPSLYKTVVSEFMLQQTQVATVLPYFARWLEELPDFPALAAAGESRVLKLWEGLGYYSRARNLHRTAQTIAARMAPPRTATEWLELPGIGPYTAAAITSIAFGETEACVDGNVVRILARLTAETREFRDGSEAVRFFTELADSLARGRDPGRHNQAMMELGATVCVRANPKCAICPVAKFCAGRATGHPGNFPRLRPRAIERKSVERVWCEHRGRLLLRRTHASAKRLAGIHELPERHDLPESVVAVSILATKRRTITRFQITETIHRFEANAPLLKAAAKNPLLEWVQLDNLDRVTLSGPHRRWIGELRRK